MRYTKVSDENWGEQVIISISIGSLIIIRAHYDTICKSFPGTNDTSWQVHQSAADIVLSYMETSTFIHPRSRPVAPVKWLDYKLIGRSHGVPVG